LWVSGVGSKTENRATRRAAGDLPDTWEALTPTSSYIYIYIYICKMYTYICEFGTMKAAKARFRP